MSQVSNIDIEGNNPEIPTNFIADFGNAVPIANTLEILGDVVPAGTIPVYTTGAGNTITTNVQISQAIAASDPTNIGLSAFNSAQFTVDADGFVSLTSSAANTSLGVDAVLFPGTDPVVPDAMGIIETTGNQIASGVAGMSVIRTFSGAQNVQEIQIQRSSSSTGPNPALNGVCHFETNDFVVDGNGYVTLNGVGAGQTLTGDSGGAIGPTGGNWNILGLSGSKTDGLVSTLTIKSPPYADAGAPATVTLNSGTFATAVITLTTPATPGLLDGELLEFVATNGVLTIQLAATQVAHLGSAVTSVAGQILGSATGDALTLRYQFSTNDFWATSIIGIWTVS